MRNRASRDGIGDLYWTHSQAGIRLSYLLTGDRASAEDLFQDAFVKAAWHLGDLRDAGAFGSYLRRTIINQYSTQWRRRARERERLEKAAAGVPTETVQPDVDLQLDMWNLLLGLPPRWRAVLYLRYYEDLSEAQTAEILKCSRRSVRSLTHRAISALRIDYRGDEG